MTIKISGETPVQINAHSCIISPSNEGYTLNYSATGLDGEWTAYSEATPANENLIINGMAWGTFIKLDGNASEVTINY